MQVAMALSGLTPREGQSLSLFDAQPNTEKLDRVVDELNLKFGRGALFWGGAYGSEKGGRMAIAFNHIPDLKTESDLVMKQSKQKSHAEVPMTNRRKNVL
jgi:DNA polymerase IV